MSPSARPDTFRFGDFELDRAAYELRRSGRRIRLERRPMDLLLLLVERRGDLVTREDMVERLWGTDVFIDVETGINTVIRKVRQALRDSPAAPRYVETVQGKGYRFIAEVEVVSGRRQPSSRHEPPTLRGDEGPVQPAPTDRSTTSGMRFGATLDSRTSSGGAASQRFESVDFGHTLCKIRGTHGSMPHEWPLMYLPRARRCGETALRFPIVRTDS